MGKGISTAVSVQLGKNPDVMSALPRIPKNDSVVSPEIACDLMMECKRIGEGRLQCPDILGACGRTAWQPGGPPVNMKRVGASCR